MNLKLYPLILVPSALILFIPAYLTNQQTTLGNYLLAAFVFEGIILFLIQHHIENKRYVKGDKHKHKEEIINQFKQNLYYERIDYDDYPSETDEKLRWVETEVFEKFLEHLKSYSQLYELYINLKNDANIKGNQIIKKIEEYKNYVKSKFDFFTDLPDSKIDLYYERPFFRKDEIIRVIARNVSLSIHRKILSPIWSAYKPNSTNYYVLSNGGQSGYAVGDESTLIKLQELTNSIQSDPKVLELINEIEQLKNIYRDTSSSLNEWHSKSGLIIKELEHNYNQKNILKGRCDWCP